MTKQILIYIVIGLLSVAAIQYFSISNLKNKLKITNNNVSAYKYGIEQWKDKFNREHTKIIEFQETINSINRSKDSVDAILIKTIKDSNIKIKQLDQAGILITSLKAKLVAKPTDQVIYIKDSTTKCQTIRDSSFMSAEVCFTPERVTSVLVGFDNTQSILFVHNKETIQPARKFFLRRWLQKKQVVCKIEIINSNPYINTTTSKFTKIIK